MIIKISVEVQVIKSFAVRIVIVSKYVYLFVAVIKSCSGICLGINPLSIACGKSSVYAKPLVFFHANVNDAGITRSIIFRRRIGNDFNAFNSTGGESAKVVGKISARHGRWLAINHNNNSLAPPEPDHIILINAYTG